MKTTFAQDLMGYDQRFTTLLLRFVLLPFSLLYLVLMTIRNALYDNGLLSVTELDPPVPVVSIGNLTVGGTGKTPLVIALARQALAEGRKVAVVTRGYGAAVDAHGTSDEVGLLRERCPGVEVVVHPNKVAGARAAAAHGADLILVDDGFQHRRLHRHLDVVVVDGRHPFGNGDVLPAGSLREPAAGLGRADVIVVTHADALDDDQREALEGRLLSHKLGVPIVYGLHVPVGVRSVKGGEIRPLDAIVGRELYLFSGIASPDGFRHTVEALGGDVVGAHGFPDHHAFRPADMAAVRAEARTAQLLCTEKDAAKVARIPGHDDVLCLVIDLVLQGEMPRLPRPADVARPTADAHGH